MQDFDVVVLIPNGASIDEKPREISATFHDFDVPVIIPDGASIDEQPGEITVTLEDIDVAVIIPDGASKDEQPGENSDTPIQVQRVSIDTASERDSNNLEISTESDPNLEIAAQWDLISEELQEMVSQNWL